MSSSPQWEYLTILVAPALLDYEDLHPKSVNGQELKNWKQIDLHAFLNQLGENCWEMTGTMITSRGEAHAHYLFFKRIKLS